MNIQSFQTQPAVEPRTIGGRLDIQSDTPALSHVTQTSARPGAVVRPAKGIESASMSKVLDPQEQQALAAAFGRSEAPSYSGRGTNTDRPPVLGLQLDLQA